jgi:GntR family transcriptional regulator/MocR family aminotransferase
MTAPFATHLTVIRLERGAGVPMRRQLYDALRAAILGGQLAAGLRLPATRGLADELGISRNTVLAAFEQLHAEGYLESRVGDGTYVAHALPERHESTQVTKTTLGPRCISSRGTLLANTPVTVQRERREGAFRHGLGALEVFPFHVWARLAPRAWRNAPRRLLAYSDPAGFMPLREAIATHLRATRSVRCDAEQVIVTTGSQQGLDLAARVLLDPGDTAWMEDPGYLGARAALRAGGAHVIDVPVDADGLDLQAGLRLEPNARLVYVTPSHQYPTGVGMSLTRRLKLLEWASTVGAWILEDDYDSEYRYTGRPLESLQGLDRDARVIYLGTFSKVLVPGLRVGYMVVPPDLVNAFVAARALMDRNTAGITQAVLTDFIREGHLARHVKRTRTLYAERQQVLLESSSKHLGGLLEVQASETGMHLVGWLPEGVSDALVSQRAAKNDIEALPISAYASRPLERGGLLLGYAAVSPSEIRAGIKRLALAVREVI